MKKRCILYFSLFLQSIYANVFINQVGYPTYAPKYVFVSQPADSFSIFAVPNNNEIFKNELHLFKSADPATGLTLYRGDFSLLTQSGYFYIEVPGLGISNNFQVNDSVYFQVFSKSLKGFYFQRCGMDLVGLPAGDYYHSRCHTLDAQFHSSTGSSGFHFASGGWHDAGDFGKYVVNAGITLGTLLMACEYFPNKFNQDDLNIPKSGNRVPDILDEIRYELDWLLKMQNNDGGVFFKVTPEQFAPFVMPQNDKSVRWIYELSSTATADFSAMMARAARIYQAFDTSFSQTCLTAAESAWSYLLVHPDIQPPGGFTNPPGTDTGGYGDTNDRDERLWAAAELYITTGKSEYHDYYQNHYDQQGLFDSAMWWGNVKNLAHFTYLFGSRGGININLQNLLNLSLTNYCQGLVEERNDNGFHVLLDPGEYVWGSNSVGLNKAIMLILCFEKTRDTQYLNIALDQLHYILGVNAHSMSFVTGIGANYPMSPHHRPSATDYVSDPVPGLLVGGPNEYLQDPVLSGNFDSATPPALCYIDDQESYASNEIAINWNAPLVFVSGYFNPEQPTSLDRQGQNFLPEGIELYQNYPNPFNGNTTISFNLPTSEKIKFYIFDVSGKRIFFENLGILPLGESEISWTPKNQGGNSLASGIYYYYLEGQYRSPVRKLVYLK
jgi:endoglucanase